MINYNHNYNSLIKYVCSANNAYEWKIFYKSGNMVYTGQERYFYCVHTISLAPYRSQITSIFIFYNLRHRMGYTHIVTAFASHRKNEDGNPESIYIYFK